MADTDLNLLTALDALLAEGSVAGAAPRLGLSASAMSRTLARLRAATGDPLLVRAGRGMVPTPRATALRKHVRDLAQDARTVLRPAVPGFRAALAVASISDLVALVTSSFFGATQGHQAKSNPVAVRSFPLPVRTEAITVSQMWHPRLDADPAHRWLRGLVLATCREQRR